MKIAILGGTGKEGSGLGFRWAAAGHEVIIGSRLAEKGERAAEEMQSELPGAAISGTDNATAAAAAELIVLSVPYEAQERTLAEVGDAAQGKLLITVVAPLGQPKARYWRLPSGLSAADRPLGSRQARAFGWPSGATTVMSSLPLSLIHISEPTRPY